MKRKALGWVIIVASILVFGQSWLDPDIYIYALSTKPDHWSITQYVLVILQVFFYFFLFFISIVFGVMLIRADQVKPNRSKILVFWLMIIIWFSLEVPIWPCSDGISHSFWKSHNKLHLH